MGGDHAGEEENAVADQGLATEGGGAGEVEIGRQEVDGGHWAGFRVQGSGFKVGERLGRGARNIGNGAGLKVIRGLGGDVAGTGLKKSVTACWQAVTMHRNLAMGQEFASSCSVLPSLLPPQKMRRPPPPASEFLDRF